MEAAPSPRRRAPREPQTIARDLESRTSLSSAIKKSSRSRDDKGVAEKLINDLKAGQERMREQGSSHTARGDSDVAAIVSRAEMTIEGIVGLVDHIKEATAPPEERAAVDSLSAAMQGRTLSATPDEPASAAQATASSHEAAVADFMALGIERAQAEWALNEAAGDKEAAERLLFPFDDDDDETDTEEMPG